MNENILISMEEYKELLIIKGKYEELKSHQKPSIQFRDFSTGTMELKEPVIEQKTEAIWRYDI